MILNEPIILDNFLPKNYVEDIYNIVFTQLPWFFVEDITYANSKDMLDKQAKLYPGFSHVLKENMHVSPFFNYFLPIIFCGLKHIDKEDAVLGVSAARAFLQLPLDKNHSSRNNIHVDTFDRHTVFLFYVNDSDGDTIIFGRDKNNNPLMSVTPKKNRAVIFDGSFYHCSSTPTKEKRAVINFNLN